MFHIIMLLSPLFVQKLASAWPGVVQCRTDLGQQMSGLVLGMERKEEGCWSTAGFGANVE